MGGRASHACHLRLAGEEKSSMGAGLAAHQWRARWPNSVRAAMLGSAIDWWWGRLQPATHQPR